MPNGYDKMIARAIINAQTASDGGKDLDIRYGENNHRHRSIIAQGYNLKEKFELRAINLINGRKSSFHYYASYVVEGRYAFVIVYFTYRNEMGVRCQVSFHNPYHPRSEISKHIGKGQKTHWDHKNSRESCKLLADIFDIK